MKLMKLRKLRCYCSFDYRKGDCRRAVYKDKHASYTKLVERAKLQTLANRRLQDICILMYKVKHRLCPNSICNIFNENTSAYNLRQSDFSTPRYNTVTYGEHPLSN